ncbi:MAG: hypothetical protein RSC48_03665 [Anaerorhabdus sp.]
MTLVNRRIFVEKKPGFRVESEDLCKTLKTNLNVDVESLRLLLTYDVFNIEETDLENAKKTVFSEVMVDEIHESVDLGGKKVIALETLPGQYDQRADSAVQCIKLLNPSATCQITTGKVILLEGDLSAEDIVKISNYLINL